MADHSKRKRDPKEHLAGGRPWQWVFESLRAAVEPASLVPSLLHFSTPTILHSCCDLPPQEVAADVVFLVQVVSEKYLLVDSRICRLVCIFARSVFQRLQLELTADSVRTLLHFFQGTITSASTVIVSGDEGGTEAGRAKIEAVAALGHFLVQLHEGALLCMDDVAGHVLFLVGLIANPVTPVPTRRSTSRSDPVARSDVHEVEVQRLTLVAIGSLISQARPLVSTETWTIIIQALTRVILESLASKKTLVEDYGASRYYLDLLRCVYILVSERPEWCLKEHVGAFVTGLRMFFRYGLGVTEGEASCNSSIWQDESEDSRSTLDFDGDPEESEVQTNDGDIVSMSTFSFDTDENASDFPVQDAFPERSSQLRLYSISTLQAMIRRDPEGVKKRSALLLLADNSMQARSEEAATLLTVLLTDPIPKVRAAAAATLVLVLGSVKLATEWKGKGPSGAQRQIFVELQTGLVYVIRNEKHNGTLLAALKALSAYIVTTPFSELSSEFLSDIVLSISKRLGDSSSFLNQSVKIAAIDCLKAALSIAPASTQLEVILSQECQTGSSSLPQPRSVLLDLISHAQQPASTNVQVEAILALKAAAHNYPGVVATYWGEIFKLVAWVIDLSLETRTGGASDHDAAHCLSMSSSIAKNGSSSGLVRSSSLSVDQLVHTALELLDELLRSASGSEVPREALLKSALPSQLSVAPEAPKLSCIPNLALQNDATTSNGMSIEQSEEDGCLQWLLALELLLPGMLEHSSPMVRGAALSCFAGLTSAVFCSLPAAKQEYILSATMRASQYDEIPAVRSVACRAVGVIVGFPQVWKSINAQILLSDVPPRKSCNV